jgi:hypothetical protein
MDLFTGGNKRGEEGGGGEAEKDLFCREENKET